MPERPAQPEGVVVAGNSALVVGELTGRATAVDGGWGEGLHAEVEVVLEEQDKTATTTNTTAGNTTRGTVSVDRDCPFPSLATLLSTLLEAPATPTRLLQRKTLVEVVNTIPDMQAATESLSSPIKGRRSRPLVLA